MSVTSYTSRPDRGSSPSLSPRPLEPCYNSFGLVADAASSVESLEGGSAIAMGAPTHQTGTSRVFAVLFSEANQDAADQLTKAYPANYKLSDTLYLVRTSSLAEDVAVGTCIKGDNRRFSGVVFKLNQAYAGYFNRSLWDWLGDE